MKKVYLIIIALVLISTFSFHTSKEKSSQEKIRKINACINYSQYKTYSYYADFQQQETFIIFIDSIQFLLDSMKSNVYLQKKSFKAFKKDEANGIKKDTTIQLSNHILVEMIIKETDKHEHGFTVEKMKITESLNY